MKLALDDRMGNNEYQYHFAPSERYAFEAEGKTWRLVHVILNVNGIWINTERQTRTGKDFTRGHGRAFMFPELPAEVARVIVAALAVNARSAGLSISV